MKTMKQGAVALAAMMALLAGCSTTPSDVKPTATAPTPTAVDTGKARADADAAKAQAAAQAAAIEAARLAEQKRLDEANRRALEAARLAAATPPAQRVVYFDFDKFAIKDEFKGLVDTFAKYLVAAPAKRSVVEGHADERGGREYNLALGQKRAEAVLKSLTLLGASEKQLEAVSFGEERPAAAGHDEAAWSKNRRAELKDR